MQRHRAMTRTRGTSDRLSFLVRSGVVLGMIGMAACSGGTSASPASPPASSPPTSQKGSAPPPPECPPPEGGSCLGPLAAGTYTTSEFQPPLTYRLPKGWGNFEDLPGNFLLIPPGGDASGVDPGTSDFVGVYTSVQAESPACGSAPDVSRSPSQMANYFTSHRELETTTPTKQVSVGGLHGVVLDLKLAKGTHKDLVCLIAGVPPSGLEHGVIPGLVMRLYLLANHDPITGGTVAIEIDDVSGGGHLDRYTSVVKDFRFKS